MLTPFGRLVRKHRIDRDMLLGHMADRLGVSSSFLSSVETGRKSIPKDGFVEQVIQLLGLSESEIAELQLAVKESSKVVELRVPREARGSDVVASFARQFDHLSDEQIAQMRAILEKV